MVTIMALLAWIIAECAIKSVHEFYPVLPVASITLCLDQAEKPSNISH